jgi:uncharacterized protein (UPF0335 family)
MPAPIEASIKAKVIRQWLSGDSRPKIAIDNNIGEGTVGSIVNYYKIGLDQSEFDSARELALQAKKQGLSLSELASNFRLHNFITTSGASEDQIESFVTNISSTGMPPEKVIELVNQIFEIPRGESISSDQLSNYITQKLEEKRRIDEQIKEVDAILQSKNVKVKTVNEHVKLTEKLDKHGLSTQDVNKLVKLVVNAKRYGFDVKKFVGKLSNIKEIEKREKGLRGNCVIFSKQAAKYKGIIPLAQLIYDLHIDKSELISFKVVVNEAAQIYGLTPSAAALRVINIVSDYNKRGQLKRELSELSLQKYAINKFCSRYSQVITAIMNLKSNGITEDTILQLNNFWRRMEKI